MMNYKEAQRRGLIDKAREKFGPSSIGRHFSEMFSGTYKEQMEKLRNADDDIRELAVGLKPDLKSAEKALKNRKYLDLFHFADSINKALSKMTERIKGVSSDRDEQLRDFYEDSEYFNPEEEYSFASIEDDLLKTAGIWDSLFGTKREREAKALEKMYKKQIRKQKVAMESLYRNLSLVVNTTLSSLKEMNGMRRRGDLEDYVNKLEKLEVSRKKFASELKALYDTYMKDIAEYKKKKRELGLEESPKSDAKPDTKAESDTPADGEMVNLPPEDRAAQAIENYEKNLPFPNEGGDKFRARENKPENKLETRRDNSKSKKLENIWDVLARQPLVDNEGNPISYEDYKKVTDQMQVVDADGNLVEGSSDLFIEKFIKTFKIKDLSEFDNDTIAFLKGEASPIRRDESFILSALKYYRDKDINPPVTKEEIVRLLPKLKLIQNKLNRDRKRTTKWDLLEYKETIPLMLDLIFASRGVSPPLGIHLNKIPQKENRLNVDEDGFDLENDEEDEEEDDFRDNGVEAEDEEEANDQGWDALASQIQNLLKLSETYKLSGLTKQSESCLNEARKLLKRI